MQNNNAYGLNACFLDAGISGTAAATTITLAAATSVSLGGIFVAVALGAKTFALVDSDGVTATATLPVLSATATSGQACTLVHCINSAGVLKTLKGPTVDISKEGDLKGSLQFPGIPDNLVPIGFFTVKNPVGSSTATFTIGSSNWNATSIVVTAYDCAWLPARPPITA